MEGFAVAEGDGGERAVGAGEKGERGFRERERSELVEGILRGEQVLIVHPDFFLAEADVVMNELAESAIGGNEGFHERES